MRLTTEYWLKYINTHTSANKAAKKQMERYIAANGTEDMQKIADFAYALVSRYGEAASALACEMYDQVARAQHADVPEAVPAETASYGEVAKAVRGAGKQSQSLIPAVVGRLVKQAGADTTLQNARRDGAYFAWVAHGDTCPYCMALAGLGWQKAGKLTLKGGHAEHIHANCDCEYAIDLKGDLEIEGYDPYEINRQIREMTGDEFDAEDLIRMSGHNAKGYDHTALNTLRRKQYAANKDYINAQKRAAYARRNGSVNKRQLELWKKYGNEQNLMLFGTSEEVLEWGKIKASVGYNESRLKKYVSENAGEWKDAVDKNVLGIDPAAKQLEERLLKQWNIDSSKMTEEELGALRFWTSGEYGRISEHFRLENGSPEIREKSALILSALDKTSTTDTLYLRRGIGNHRLNEILKKVAGWEDDISKAVGADYAETSVIATTPFKNGAYGGIHHIYYKVPPGVKGTYIKRVSHADDELEFLMQLGTKGRIVDMKKVTIDDRWGTFRYELYVEIAP